MNKVILALFAASVGLGLVSMHLVRQLRVEREQARSLQAQVEALQRTQAAAPPAALGADVMPASSPVVAPEPPPLSPAANRVDPTDPKSEAQVTARRQMRASLARQQALLRDPQYRAAMRTQHKLTLARMHPSLARDLGLSDAQVDQLLTLLAEQQLAGTEYSQAPIGDAPPGAASMEAARNAWQERERMNEMELAALLGDAKLQEWKQYQQSMGARYRIDQLRNALAGTAAPLRDDQVKPLSIVLGERQRQLTSSTSNERGNQFPDSMDSSDRLKAEEEQLERLSEFHRQTRQAVAHILSAAQLKAYERMHDDEIEMQRSNLQMMRAKNAAVTRGEVNGASQKDAAVGFVAEEQLER